MFWSSPPESRMAVDLMTSISLDGFSFRQLLVPTYTWKDVGRFYICEVSRSSRPDEASPLPASLQLLPSQKGETYDYASLMHF